MWLTGRDRLETAGQLGRLGYGGVNRRKDPATTGEIVTRMFISSHRMAENNTIRCTELSFALRVSLHITTPPGLRTLFMTSILMP